MNLTDRLRHVVNCNTEHHLVVNRCVEHQVVTISQSCFPHAAQGQLRHLGRRSLNLEVHTLTFSFQTNPLVLAVQVIPQVATSTKFGGHIALGSSFNSDSALPLLGLCERCKFRIQVTLGIFLRTHQRLGQFCSAHSILGREVDRFGGLADTVVLFVVWVTVIAVNFLEVLVTDAHHLGRSQTVHVLQTVANVTRQQVRVTAIVGNYTQLLSIKVQ